MVRVPQPLMMDKSCLVSQTRRPGGSGVGSRGWRPNERERHSRRGAARAFFAAEARRRCDVIAAGLATETSDFETMRAEAHALKDTAAVVGLRRLAELAGLMESDLAEAKTTGSIRGGRAHQVADAVKALAEGASAAAEGKEEPPDVGRSLAQLFSA
jgi:HPt (histidine-containing phosphotransfer) domain-containing protein